jgi:hypothetical protein
LPNLGGGRAWTAHSLLGENYPLELGAEFIHGSKTVTMDLCKQAGLTLIPVERKKKMWWADGAQGPAVPVHQLPVSLQEELQKLHQDYDNLSQAVLQKDVSLEDYLRLRGWKNEEALRRADVLFSQTCCNTLREHSCFDLKEEMRVDHSGTGEFRIKEGYNALWNYLSKGVPIQYNTVVCDIEWHRDGVVIYDREGLVQFGAKNTRLLI